MKLFERVIHTKLVKFATDNNVIDDELAIQCHQTHSRTLGAKNVDGHGLVDIEKAFDAV